MSTCEVAVVPPTDSSAAALLVTVGQRRLLVDCGEGTQRIANERKLRLTRLGHVLLTRARGEALEGLPGMLLTLADVEMSRDPGKFSLEIFGPPQVADFVHALRFVYRRPGSSLTVKQVPSRCAPVTLAEGLVLHPVVALEDLEQAPPAKRARLDTVKPATEYIVPPKFGALFVDMLPTDDGECKDNSGGREHAVSYMLELPAKRGKFLKDKAVALGVKPGPDFGRLTKGQAVTTEAGAVVRPEDCMADAEPAQSIVIVACPSAEYVDHLVASPEWKPIQERAGVQFVFHIAPANVLESPAYSAWAARFTAPSAQHVLVCRGACGNGAAFLSSARLQQLLSERVDPDLYPRDATWTQLRDSSPTSLDKVCPGFLQAVGAGRVAAADTSSRYVVQPASQRGIQRHEVPENGLAAGLEAPRPALSYLPQEQFEVTFLGTGAALPSKYRNVSATLVRFGTPRGVRAILLDAGEGTVVQMRRRFGLGGADKILHLELEMVWVSHMHADHHLGLLHVLRRRGELDVPSRLAVIGPPALGRFLQGLAQGSESASLAKLEFTPIVHPNSERANVVFQVTDARLGKRLGALGVLQMTSVPVDHCFDAYGLVLDTAAGKRFVYSGDTRPCEALVKAGSGATLLVHEATFEDDKVADAVAKKHSTTKEAIDVGRRMRAEFTALTHFSQRYPKNLSGEQQEQELKAEQQAQQEQEQEQEQLAGAGAGARSNVIVATDLMSIRSDDLERAARCSAMAGPVLEAADADEGGSSSSVGADAAVAAAVPAAANG